MRRWLLIGGSCLLVLGAMVGLLPSTAGNQARSAALAELQHDYPSVTWRVSATQFYWRPDRVYEPSGNLAFSESGGPTLLQPTYFVFATGSTPKLTYSAMLGVDPLTHRIGVRSVANTPTH